MLIKRPADIPSSEITPERIYLDRRRFMREAAKAAAAVAATPTLLAACDAQPRNRGPAMVSEELEVAMGEGLQEELTPYEDVTTYNNFYEFGTAKEDPSRNSGRFEPRPWTLAVGGHCENGGSYDLDDFIQPHTIEDRVYRLRCVEAWSMVIPWRGFPLKSVIDRARPTSKAKFVAFTTVTRPSQMPGQRAPILDWPYREGLRLDEASHPLTLLATGLYGRDLPNQNGAPLRLVVPWKYGFKSIKSIVKIDFVERMPYTTWNAMAPQEYGFYANVNPAVDHPRWSQARERRIGEFRKRETLPFNGYADLVAPMYRDLDLRKWY
ncbi:MAG TPA: protein-methionine-sulfoxide reductase catalytic subunit MsrP [Longimicrobiales bacterium]|nr:protein-methionine-sulfoxide reductase catalytic subunit MsrP [Longimicrobiales bacterium]